MRLFFAFAIFFIAATLTAGHTADRENLKKVALVIGNSNYAYAVRLTNPAKDAALMATTLRNAGFTVLEGDDLDKIKMGSLLDQFAELAYDADIALVYYAGHGLQVDGQNYLIPVDAQLEKAAQLQSRTISVNYMLSKLPADPTVSILILDACRDNPLARTLAAALPKSRSSAVGSGLAAVQANGQSYGTGGLLIAYATDPGSVAYDGSSQNSPYTKALARHLTTPGLEIQSALTRVRAEVSQETNGAQRPWHNASLAREVFLGEPPTLEVSPPQEPIESAPTQPSRNADVDWTVEQKLWDEASKRNTVAHYEFYLSQYPNGRFAGIARLNIDQLKTAGETRVVNIGPQTDVAPSEPQVMEPGDVKQTPGTPETEALIKLDRDGRVDVQLRLSALGLDTGGFDGSFGPRSRTAIGAWQRRSGIVETTFLTPRQHALLVVQTDPLMAEVRAKYEKDKSAALQPRVATPKPPPKKKKTQETIAAPPPPSPPKKPAPKKSKLPMYCNSGAGPLCY